MLQFFSYQIKQDQPIYQSFKTDQTYIQWVIILNNKWYRPSYKFIEQSYLFRRYFKTILDEEHDNSSLILKIFKIQSQEISFPVFQKILKVFNTGTIQESERGDDCLKMLKTIRMLGIQSLFNEFEIDFRVNFQQYGLFTLHEISKEFSIDWLRKMCLNQLLKYNFEHLNFCKYDLLRCSIENFKTLIKIHQDCLKLKQSRCLSAKNIKDIIKEYQEFNNVKIDSQQLLQELLQTIDQQEELALKSQSWKKNFIFPKPSIIQSKCSYDSKLTMQTQYTDLQHQTCKSTI